ncbi:hypothetical protein CK203_040956 [Vitis vinifera]|uniref:Uncharacterized protein n=1 Tax=Vitis vinifera TaxID=29760 RepID=A0A438HVB8_VITVI|nr:hypothetical protein CK203_040956 [Vitis vinifera]
MVMGVGKHHFLWKQVIDGKFDEIEGGWRSNKLGEAFGVRLWEAIRHEWNEFWHMTSISIANGAKTKSS